MATTNDLKAQIQGQVQQGLTPEQSLNKLLKRMALKFNEHYLNTWMLIVLHELP
ncbi:hypothetical protein LSPH24S_06380 [Lysinibacillus sphaericus]